MSKGSLEASDLLSILMTAGIYEGDDELVKDEIFTIFFAGMTTI